MCSRRFAPPFLSLIFLWTVAALAAPTDSSNRPSASANQALAEEGRRFALLVGCTKYDNNRLFRLVGPANDVELFRRVLEDKLSYRPEDIVVLSENAGGDHRPTYANIAREFAELVHKARPGDRVVILLGGHGSQQPEQNPPDFNYPKPDGRDQIFLPADIGVWDGDVQHKVAKSIPDYELRKWTKAITSTGASLWLVVDACCSGATLRGEGDETPRKVRPEDLGIPSAALAAAADRARRRGIGRGAGAPDLLFQLDTQSPNFVALYAARPDEPTVERPLPLDDDNAPRHGLLTFTVCEIIERTGGHITYSELHRLICNRYSQMGRTNGPRPLVEGLARDATTVDGRRLIFTRDGNTSGSPSEPSRSGPAQCPFTLKETPTGGWKIDAGRLQGLTPNSVLAVFAFDKANRTRRIGHVRIQQAKMLESDVAPCDFAGQPIPDRSALVAGSPCDLVYLDYGTMRLRVAVDKTFPAGGKTSPSAEIIARLNRIERDLSELAARPGALLDMAKQGERPDWVVQPRGKDIVLVAADAAAIAGELPSQTPRVVVPEQATAKALAECIGRIVRTRNLLSLTAPGPAVRPADRDEKGLSINADAIDVEVEMVKLRDKDDTQGTPIHADGREMTLPAGQWVGWRMTNHSRFKVDVTLLFIDSDFSIVSAFPRPGSGVENMIPPGGHILRAQARATPTTFDLDRMVTIAVRSDGQPIDFSVLQQPSITALRGAGDRAMDSPLGRLFRTALYGAGTTRGGENLGRDYRLDLVSWRVK